MTALDFIKYAWVVQAGLLTVTTIVVQFVAPETMPVWVQALPVLGGLTALEGGAGFGGPAIKRAQETKANPPVVNDGR